jgi:flagellar hook-associated protein 3 FlgL
MRVTQSLSYRNFLSNVESLNERMETASQQVSTGKKLVHLKDSPTGSAELVDLRSELGQIDQYRSNADNGSFMLNITDSALNSVYNLLTDIFTNGSEAANNSTGPEVRAGVVQAIRAMRDQIFSLANLESRGRYIFAGSRVTAAPFTMAGDTVTYQGDTEVNTIDIGDGVRVKENLIGSTVFEPIFNTINTLLTALENNDESGIKIALSQFGKTFSGLSQARAEAGVELSKVQDIQYDHDTRETAIRTRQSRVEDANLAEAITRMNQLQTALQATLSAQSMVQRQNLFDYLG